MATDALKRGRRDLGHEGKPKFPLMPGAAPVPLPKVTLLSTSHRRAAGKRHLLEQYSLLRTDRSLLLGDIVDGPQMISVQDRLFTEYQVYCGDMFAFALGEMCCRLVVRSTVKIISSSIKLHLQSYT